ncbi:hypothetical protein LZ575_11130 [Antarcticibacterium sp. 1MA-6-2]|uniref:hypothetical protein n=1 Tax=Antarcticibacterium sp. 1MA-6-2 TaxID=2908210 RepID=UPI001F2FB06A|nr:hypothetical protein [Antarcticibacterium sp. 1MA-6-2]UJH89645.1 hypothetical protein LZ575_11130 [Antarcticibacterium sp. 1MA-6-2]
MLSQKLTKDAFKLLSIEDWDEKLKIKDSIEATLERWKFFHAALRQGNDSLGLPDEKSREITAMFAEVEPYFLNTTNAAEALISQLEGNSASPFEDIRTHISVISNNEAEFLRGMDQIVNQFEKEAAEKVKRLENLELLLMAITLIILLSELFSYFCLSSKGCKGYNSKIIAS